jgi:hypothetical protein
MANAEPKSGTDFDSHSYCSTVSTFLVYELVCHGMYA